MSDPKKLTDEEIKQATGAGAEAVNAGETPGGPNQLGRADLQHVSGSGSSVTHTEGAQAAGASFSPTLEGDIIEGDERRIARPD